MRWLFSKNRCLLFLIIFFSLIVRLWRLDTPSHPYFDEVYHVPAVRLIAANDPRAYEWWHQPILNENFHDWLHPPAAKLIQAASIKILGNRPLAWRLPSALAGTGLILVVYLLSQQIFKNLYSVKKAARISLLAALITALSGLVLVQSRIAMNDIFLTLCLLLSVLFFYRWKPDLFEMNYFFAKDKQKKLVPNDSSQFKSPLNLMLSGLFLGLALASKWTALFLIIFLFIKLSWFVFENKTWKLLPITIFSFLILPLALYLSAYTQMFMQNKDLIDFAKLHQQIIWYQFNRSEGHEYASTPPEWLINLRPVLYWRDETLDGGFKNNNSQLTANIYALGNPAIHVLSQISLVFLVGLMIKDKLRSSRSKIYLNLILLYALFWLPWILSPRVIFYHHYLPAIPFLSLIISEFLQIYLKPFSKTSFWFVIALIVICFVIFYPHWTGITVFKSWAERVYFGLRSWQ